MSKKENNWRSASDFSEIEMQVRELKRWFESHGKTLGFAESCTGGLLSSWLTSQAGVSSFFRGSIISYSGKIKEKVLGVPRHILQCLGEVNLPVALCMAKGARKVLEVDWALSITGVAGPTGGTKDKPLGFVCFALCGPGIDRVEQRYFDGKERMEVQFQSASYGLELLLTTLNCELKQK
jgi:PncC family amidohydrolase